MGNHFTCGIMVKNSVLIFVFIFLHSVFGIDHEIEPDQEEMSKQREGRQFFVTTTTATTTLTTLKLCWIQFTSATGMMRCRRRREIPNKIIIDSFVNSPDKLKISPNPTVAESDYNEDHMDYINDGREVLEENELSSSMDERKAKFLNYWMTITKTMTITSCSTTSSFGSLICTPTSFGYGPCPGNGWIGK